MASPPFYTSFTPPCSSTIPPSSPTLYGYGYSSYYTHEQPPLPYSQPQPPPPYTRTHYFHHSYSPLSTNLYTPSNPYGYGSVEPSNISHQQPTQSDSHHFGSFQNSFSASLMALQESLCGIKESLLVLLDAVREEERLSSKSLKPVAAPSLNDVPVVYHEETTTETLLEVKTHSVGSPQRPSSIPQSILQCALPDGDFVAGSPTAITAATLVGTDSPHFQPLERASVPPLPEPPDMIVAPPSPLNLALSLTTTPKLISKIKNQKLPSSSDQLHSRDISISCRQVCIALPPSLFLPSDPHSMESLRCFDPGGPLSLSFLFPPELHCCVVSTMRFTLTPLHSFSLIDCCYGIVLHLFDEMPDWIVLSSYYQFSLCVCPILLHHILDWKIYAYKPLLPSCKFKYVKVTTIFEEVIFLWQILMANPHNASNSFVDCNFGLLGSPCPDPTLKTSPYLTRISYHNANYIASLASTGTNVGIFVAMGLSSISIVKDLLKLHNRVSVRNNWPPIWKELSHPIDTLLPCQALVVGMNISSVFTYMNLLHYLVATGWFLYANNIMMCPPWPYAPGHVICTAAHMLVGNTLLNSFMEHASDVKYLELSYPFKGVPCYYLSNMFDRCTIGPWELTAPTINLSKAFVTMNDTPPTTSLYGNVLVFMSVFCDPEQLMLVNLGPRGSNTRLRMESKKQWDPGEDFSMSKVTWSLQFKQWDPGKLIHREYFYNLEDKVGLDGQWNVRNNTKGYFRLDEDVSPAQNDGKPNYPLVILVIFYFICKNVILDPSND